MVVLQLCKNQESSLKIFLSRSSFSYLFPCFSMLLMAFYAEQQVSLIARLVSLLKELGTSFSKEITEKRSQSLESQLVFFSAKDQTFKETLVSCRRGGLTVQVPISTALSLSAGYQGAHGCC